MKSFVTAALALSAIGGAHAATVTRYTLPPMKGAPALILQGAEVAATGKTFYLSGQVAAPLDPAKASATNLTMADYGDTHAQTVSVLTKIKTILASHGYTMADVVKLTVFVAGDPKLGGKMDFEGMNAGFKQFFNSADNPTTVARSTIQVAALAGPAYLVEIEATAAK